MIKEFVQKIAEVCKKNNRFRIIPNRLGTGTYLERYYIFLKDRKKFPFNAVIHKFVESDEDDLHDHPWWFFTFIIYGEYDEHTPDGIFRRKPFQFRFYRSTDLHSVKLINNTPVWTFFVMGPQKREWGFVHNGKWIQWKEYVQQLRGKHG